MSTWWPVSSSQPNRKRRPGGRDRAREDAGLKRGDVPGVEEILHQICGGEDAVRDAGGANRLLHLPFGAEERQRALRGGAIAGDEDQVRDGGGSDRPGEVRAMARLTLWAGVVGGAACEDGVDAASGG